MPKTKREICINPVLAYAVVNRDKPFINPYWLVRQIDLPEIHLQDDEEIITVTITPSERKAIVKTKKKVAKQIKKRVR